MTTHTLRWLLPCVLILAAVGSARGELPETGAALAPADTAVFIELDDLADLRAQLENDPLVDYLREQTPARREPAAWQAVQQMLGLSGEEIFDRYFGRRVVIFGSTTQEGGPGLLLSRVSDDDATRAIDRLQLQQLATPGDFTLYQTSDGNGRIAFAEGWMAMGDPKHDDYIRRTLESIGDGASLADDEQFQQWIAKVDEDSFARLFIRPGDGDQHHAASLQREGGRLQLNYAGHNREARELLDRLGDAAALEFGPLPRQTLSATSLNLRDRQPDPRWVELMNRLVAPASYEEDVLPMLDAPLVAFLGEAPGETLDPPAAFDAPVLGLAIKLRDHQAAEHLDRAMQGLISFANLATMQMNVDAIETLTSDHEGVTFHHADVGNLLARQLDEPGLRDAAQLSFGRIGDWYVVTTNARFFRASIDADRDESARLTAADDMQAFNLAEHERPVLTSFTRTPQLAAHLQSWLDHLADRAPHWVEDAQKMEPTTDAGRAVRGLSLLAGVLEHYQAASLQVFAEDDDTIRATATLQRN